MADGSDHTEPLPGSTIRITTYDDRYMLWFPHDPLPGEDEVPSVPPPFSPNVNVDQGRLLGTQTHPSPDGQLSVETRWEGRLID